MATLTHDTVTTAPSRAAAGIAFALGSATSFALSGPLAKGLITAGWTPGAAVTIRVLIAAAVLLVPMAISLRGRWSLLRDNLRLIAAYGLIAVAGCQLAYFNAVDHMQVGVAILIEFMSPVVVIGWLWFRHGQRPSRLTVLGAVLAVGGLLLVLDLVSGADVEAVGIAWGLGAMAGVAFYWIISADEDNGVPGIVLAGGGLVVGGTALLLAGLVGILPMTASRDDVVFDGVSVPWWLTVVALGAITAALPYVLGIAGIRRLGSRLASFVGLFEVVASVLFAWLLLGEAPRSIQLLGGALILAGVVAVRLGEPRVEAAPSAGATP